MSDEHDVRDLLTRVVPEQPAVDRMVGLARRRRVRRTQTAVAAGALAVVAAVAIPLGVERFTSDDAAIDPAFDPRVAAEVYAANPCPDEMPTYEDLPRALPDLTRVTVVRYCTNPEVILANYGQLIQVEPPTAAAIRESATPDALLTGLPGFLASVTELEAADPDPCATVSYLPGGDALALQLDDGAQVLVSVDGCTNVRRSDGSLVAGTGVAGAFYRALDAQRADYAYEGGPDGLLTCASPAGDGNPLRPDRETLVAAVACPSGESDSPEQDVDVDQLDRAWRDAAAEVDPDTTVENPCTETDERLGVILARTDRGDTIRLLDSPCGFLAFSTTFDGRIHYQLPTSLAALTD